MMRRQVPGRLCRRHKLGPARRICRSLMSSRRYVGLLEKDGADRGGRDLIVMQHLEVILEQQAEHQV